MTLLGFAACTAGLVDRLGLERSSVSFIRRPVQRNVRSVPLPVLITSPLCHAHAPSTHVPDSRTLPLEPGTWDGSKMDPQPLISAVKFDSAGLVPAVAQQYDTGEVLMVAWMNAESIAVTLQGGRAVYYSRSRQELWRKGDTSGQIQVLCDVLLDCDGDTLVLKVDQLGVACHTGRRSCFYNAYRPPNGERTETMDVLMDPKAMYGK